MKAIIDKKDAETIGLYVVILVGLNWIMSLAGYSLYDAIRFENTGEGLVLGIILVSIAFVALKEVKKILKI
jgi:hypothetical protein